MLHITPPRTAILEPLSPQQAAAHSCLCRDPKTLKSRSVSVSLGVTAPFPWSWCAHGFVCALQASLVAMRFDFKPPSHHLAAASSLPLVMGYLFLVSFNILLSIVVQQLITILEFSQGKMSVDYSTILDLIWEYRWQ